MQVYCCICENVLVMLMLLFPGAGAVDMSTDIKSYSLSDTITKWTNCLGLLACIVRFCPGTDVQC